MRSPSLHYQYKRMISLKMFAAKDGDAFLINANYPHRAAILVDGGYSSTFHSSILPVLREMHASGLSLDLVLATHIDADHISGLLELFKNNGMSADPAIIRINNVWHNSLRCLSIDRAIEVSSSDDEELLAEICGRGFLELEDKSQHSEISARQGSSLAAHLLKGRYVWNNDDGRQSISATNTEYFNLTADVRC